MTPGLESRIEEIPGVAAVTIDLTDSGGGIKVRLEPGADQSAVMDKVRGLLAAYGAKPHTRPVGEPARRGPSLEDATMSPASDGLGVDLHVTPTADGARVEVATESIRSYRIVEASPSAIAQGVADAWCQVIGRVPVSVASVGFDESGRLEVVVGEGDSASTGTAHISMGWEQALGRAVGLAIGAIPTGLATSR